MLLAALTATSLLQTTALALPSIAAESVTTIEDAPFYQEVSFKAQYSVQGQGAIANWEQLPFEVNDTQQVIFAQDRNCFVALSHGILYAAALKSDYNKVALESPYTSWEQLYNLNDDASVGSAVKLVQSASEGSSFFVVTENNVVALALSEPSSGVSSRNTTTTHSDASSCGYVKSTYAIITGGTVHWGDRVSAVTSSRDAVWVASPTTGLSQVTLADGNVASLNHHMMNGDNTAVTALHWVDQWQQLFVGTPSTLYTMHYEHAAAPARTSHEWVGGIIDTAPLDMAFDATHDALWLAESGSVHKLSADGRWWRYGLSQGSPFISNITSVALSSDDSFVWVGTSQYGLARLHSDAEPVQRGARCKGCEDRVDGDPLSWSFYSGNRYLPDNSLSAVVAGRTVSAAGSAVLAVGSTGMGLLDSTQWTLAEKAQVYNAMQSRHDRDGLTTENVLAHYGDITEYLQDCNDNDGLWTSMHAMGEVYRHLVTGEEEARQLAWKAFEGLEKLSKVPGNYPYFPARSFATDAENAALGGCQGDVWVKSTAVEGYYWKSTTSSDEIDGHLAIYPLIYDHIATTEEERDRAYVLIEGITGGILANNLYLVDPSTGEPTQWGFWNPEEVNENPERYGERGPNSLGILSYFASAYSVTKDSKYKDAFWDLATKHGYISNMNNAKIDAPLEDNHSDNELLFQAYHILFYALNRLSKDDAVYSDVHAMVDVALPSIDRMWSIVNPELSPLWVAIYGGVCHRPVTSAEVSDATWSLRRWALDLIKWPVDNAVRYDVTLSPYTNRGKEGDYTLRQVVPPSERPTAKWNTNPYEVSGGSGTNEEAPWVWALPYYMMRYHGMVEAAKD